MTVRSGNKKIKISSISAMHYSKLVIRSLVFLGALTVYVILRVKREPYTLWDVWHRVPLLFVAAWVMYALEMVFRFFPSALESMGCQKQFEKNYRPTGRPAPARRDRFDSAMWVLIAWLGLNGAIGALHLAGLIDAWILVLISLAYGVCDMICILYFCPFQTWFMKNKCCGSCRIYNWDYAMMFTPLIFIPHAYSWSLLALGFGLVVKWELVHFRHPERFYEVSNASLRCAHCPEKLCAHKTQLQRFLIKYRHILRVPGLIDKSRKE